MPDEKQIKKTVENTARAEVKSAATVVVDDAKAIVEKIEAWFARHFSHVTPGTHDHTVLVQAKADLQATLAPAAAPTAEKTDPAA